MEVANPDSELEQVVGEVLRHLLGERRDEHARIDVGATVDLRDEVVDLALGRLHDDLGIDESRGANDLLDDLRRRLALVGARRRRHEHDLVDAFGELLEAQWPVVHRRRQTEAVLDQRVLARPVALELTVQLRDRHV